MDLDTDLNFQRRIWTVQRIGWLMIGLVILATLMGAFGNGLLSRVSASGNGLRLEYERFGRLQQPTRLHFLLPPSKHDAEVSLRRDYLAAFQIDHITPEPKEVAPAGPWLTYRFAGPGPLAVTFDVVPLEFGRLQGNAAISPSVALAFQQFIYP
jgi:hypothetical protein